MVASFGRVVYRNMSSRKTRLAPTIGKKHQTRDFVVDVAKSGGRFENGYEPVDLRPGASSSSAPWWTGPSLLLLLLLLLGIALGAAALGIALRGPPSPPPEPETCELKLPLFDADHYTTPDCGDVTDCLVITQALIDSEGTFRIRESNCPGESCCAYVESDLYWNDPILLTRPLLGWSAMITVERSNVDLCLNGKTLRWNESAAEKLFDPSIPFLNPMTTMSEDDIVGFDNFNFLANFNTLFIFVSLNSFPGSPQFALQGAVFALGFPDTITDVPPYFYNQTTVTNVTVRNGKMGHGPHMGIQSLDNSEVVISNVQVFDVPVSGMNMVMGGLEGWNQDASGLLIENCTVIGTAINDTIFTLGNLERIAYATTMFLGLATLDPIFGPIIAFPKPPEWQIPRDFSFGTGEVTVAQIQKLIWDLNLELMTFPLLGPGQAGFTFANNYGISVRPTVNREALEAGGNPFYPKDCDNRAGDIIVRYNVIDQLRTNNENYVLVETNNSLVFHFILNPNWEDFFTAGVNETDFGPSNFVQLGLVLGYPVPSAGVFEPNLDWYASLIPSGTLNETLFYEYAHPLFGFNRDGSPAEGVQGIQTWCESDSSVYGNHVKEVYNLSPNVMTVDDIVGGENATASVYSINEQRRAAGFLIVNASTTTISCNTIEAIFSADVFVPPTDGTVASIRFIYQNENDVSVIGNSLSVK